MKQFLLVSTSLILIALHSNAQTWQWTKPEKGSENQGERTVTDTNGNLYTLGCYYDSLFLNGVYRAKGNGSYVAKFDSTGKLIWYDIIRSSIDDVNSTPNVTGNDMIVNNDGIFLVGYMLAYGLPYTYKIGSSSFVVDTTGQYKYGTLNNFFISKIDFNGTVQWNKISKFCNTNVFNYGLSICSDKQNNIVVGGTRLRPGNVNYKKYDTFYVANDIIVNNYNHYGIPNNSENKCFILKYGTDGAFKWSNFIDPIKNAGNNINARSIASDNNNNIWIWLENYDSTYFANSLFTTLHKDYNVETLSKLNGLTGAFIFTKELSTLTPDDGDNSYSKSHLLTCDNTNNIYVLVSMGTLSGGVQAYLDNNIAINSTGTNIYTLKYSNSGNLIWYKLLGHTQDNNNNPDDKGSEINFYNSKLYYSGTLRSSSSNFPYNNQYFLFSSLTVPDSYLPNQFITGALKQFIAKSDTAGNFEWATTVGGGSNAEAFSVAAFGDNVYTAGYYRYKIILGNLSGYLNSNDGYLNLFYGSIKDRYIRVGALSNTKVIPGCTISIPFSSNGLLFSNANTFTAELSNASGDFTSPYQIGSVISTGSGTINATIPNTLLIGTSGYKIRIKSSDTLLTGYNYYAYADTGYTISIACSPAPSGLTTTNITGTSATLNWTTVSCAAGYKVQYRKKGTTAWTTIQINTNTGTASLSGLTVSTIYQWRVATKCKSSGTTTYSAYSAIKQFTTSSTFIASGFSSKDETAINKNFKVYPNPANSKATVEFNLINSSTYTLEISDLTGKVLLRKKDAGFIDKNIIQIDVSRLAQSIYLISIIDEQGKRTIKLRKE